VDGGASKVDVVLLDASGALVGAARLAASGHFGLGRDGQLESVERAIRAAGEGVIEAGAGPLADLGVYCLAGADLPVDDRRIAAEIEGRGWTRKTVVRNDTFAVLRAGTERGWGVAVVCGTGLNCAGIAPDGRTVRFPSFGELSGDRAHGGGWLGRAALGAAIRARDGRGPRTALERLVPEHFQMSSPAQLMEAIYLEKVDYGRAHELSPVVFAAARGGDAVARGLLDEMADEIVTTAVAAIRRLRVTSKDVDVVLGGGVFRSHDRRFMSRIEAGLQRSAPRSRMQTLTAPPVLGAALMGLDLAGAGSPAKARLRKALTHARLRPATRSAGRTSGRGR